MKQKRTVIAAIGACLVLGALGVQAREVVLHPNTTTTQWRTRLQEDPIEAMHVWVRRASGDSGTYFNMRFGREGHTFDGRRVYLKGNGTVKASWALNGRRPDGKELIMNSYNGRVHLERVVVVFRSGRQSEHYYDRSNDRYNRDSRYDRDDRYDSRYRSSDRSRNRYDDYDRYRDRRQCDSRRDPHRRNRDSDYYRNRWTSRW